ncbi:MAG: UDP-glucose 4-epimerase GalE [Hyphococcus sp.]|nr:MAG: UDP-glucose 4-epimerase GalE [Marinicaulis sp.]
MVKKAQKIIVAGGAGYIGSHVVVELLGAGRDVLIIDNFSNSHPEAINRITKLAPGNVELLERDLINPAHKNDIISAVKDFDADSAIHLAGLKAVGESVAEPVRYYETNIGSALTLLSALEAADANTIVFSSSATVYGELNQNPVDETGLTGATNPYGRTKLFIEDILKDLCASAPKWKAINLRYFNPVGAHPSGQIGEDPNGVPNNLFPFIAQVAVGRREKLSIFGDDYDTRDGTGVRDYIHVVDLARGHLAALDYLFAREENGAIDVNLGTGAGVSVLEAVAAFKRASNKDIPYQIAPRRDGDVAEIYADARLANELFNWRADKTIEDMCADHWRWQSNNPNGYKD